MTKPRLTAHHIGCLTENIEESIAVYRQMGFDNVSKVFDIKFQNVKVCFIEIRPGFFLELVQFPETSYALKDIFDTGNAYYHIGYLVEDLDATAREFEAEGFICLDKFSSEAFHGKSCIFLHTPERQLIELIEK